MEQVKKETMSLMLTIGGFAPTEGSLRSVIRVFPRQLEELFSLGLLMRESRDPSIHLSQNGWLCLKELLDEYVGEMARSFLENAKATPMTREELREAEKDGGPCTPLKPGEISFVPSDIGEYRK